MELLKKNNIITFASFIIGFPGESDETMQETADFIRNTKPDYYRLAMWFCKNTAPILQKKDVFGIQGDGFKWKHNSMDSMEAIAHIERLYLEIDESVWMPQRSFDFWHIPYLLGKGFTREQFNHFMIESSKLLRMEVLQLSNEEKFQKQEEIITDLREYLYNSLPEEILDPELIQHYNQELEITSKANN
jgi:p-methyltransferase